MIASSALAPGHVAALTERGGLLVRLDRPQDALIEPRRGARDRRHKRRCPQPSLRRAASPRPFRGFARRCQPRACDRSAECARLFRTRQRALGAQPLRAGGRVLPGLARVRPRRRQCAQESRRRAERARSPRRGACATTSRRSRSAITTTKPRPAGAWSISVSAALPKAGPSTRAASAPILPRPGAITRSLAGTGKPCSARCWSGASRGSATRSSTAACCPTLPVGPGEPSSRSSRGWSTCSPARFRGSMWSRSGPALYGGEVCAHTPIGEPRPLSAAERGSVPATARTASSGRTRLAQANCARGSRAMDARSSGSHGRARIRNSRRPRARGCSISRRCCGDPAAASSICNTATPSADREAVEREFGVHVEHLDDIDNTRDIDGLAALMAACDAVVTVSNTTAHLAGALGRPTLVFVPYGHARLWYWFKDRDDSPWYPRLHVKRQQSGQSWADLIAASSDEIAAALSASQAG